MMRIFIVFLLAVFLTNCQPNQGTENIVAVDQIIADVKSAHAPDKRVALFAPEYRLEGANLLISGKTNLPEAAQVLKTNLSNLNYTLVDSLSILPDTEKLEGQIFGIVNLSVCNIRSNPKHSAELSTQSTMGTSLNILEKDGDWFLVQTPDGYLGWLDQGGLHPVPTEAYQHWKKADKVVVTNDMLLAMDAPNTQAKPVSDLISGNILIKGQVGPSFTEVIFPDGRTAFIPNDSYEDYLPWINQPPPSTEQLLQTAYQYLGRPYLWGGTSSRAMDCSGFTKTVFYLNGLLLPRDASQQVHTGAPIATENGIDDLRPGDLLFFGRTPTAETPEKITHVALYAGSGKIIHASGSVKIQSLDPEEPDFAPERLSTFVRAKRFFDDEGQPLIPRLNDMPAYQKIMD